MEGHRFLEATRIRCRAVQLPKPSAKEREGDELALPDRKEPSADIWEVIRRRRSRRRFSLNPLELLELSALLVAAQGETGSYGRIRLRAAPSAGACYPLETRVAVQRVTGLSPGPYRFDPGRSSLVLYRQGVPPSFLAHACLDQGFIAQAAAVVAWTAVVDRTVGRYGDRGVRYLFLDAGHACQNLLLAAEALGLAACPVGAFCDDLLDQLLGVDPPFETTLYLAAVGHPAGEGRGA